jgi:hypothetical protein
MKIEHTYIRMTDALYLEQKIGPWIEYSSLGGGGGVGWERAKSYDREKAWPTINHSILSSVSDRRISLLLNFNPGALKG